MTIQVNLLVFTISRQGLTDVRILHKFTRSVIDFNLDNDFSEFQKPDHYIRYIGGYGGVDLGLATDIRQSHWREI